MDVGNLNDVDSRGALAVARTNWLHDRYPQIVSTCFCKADRMKHLTAIRKMKITSILYPYSS